MPFKSQAQRRFLYATNPKVANKFSAHTQKGKKLPERVKKDSLEKTAFKKRLGRLLQQSVAKRRKTYAPTDVLAHELGHIKAFNKGLAKPRLALYSKGPSAAKTINMLGSLDSTAQAGAKLSRQRALVMAAGHTPRLAEEAVATYYGLKAMKKLRYISPKMYSKARSNLFKAYGTYLVGAASDVAVAGASGYVKNAPAQLSIQLASKRVGNTVNKTLFKSLIRGQGKGGLSNRRQMSELSRVMGIKDQPLFALTKGFSGSALPKDIISKRQLKQIGKQGLEAMLTAKRGGIVQVQGGPKSAFGKFDLGEKFYDSLENLGKKLQAE